MHVVLISSGSLTRDPRFLYMADCLRERGYDVSGINLFRGDQCADIDDTCDFAQRFAFVNLKVMRSGAVEKMTVPTNTKMIHAPSHSSCLARCLVKLKGVVQRFLPWLSYWLFLRCNEQAIAKHVQSSILNALVQDVDIFYGCEMHFGAEYACLLAQKHGKLFIDDVKEHYAYQDDYPWYVRRHIEAKERDYFAAAVLAPCVAAGIQQALQKLHPGYGHKMVLLENAMPFLATIEGDSMPVPSYPLKGIMSLGAVTPHRGVVEFLHIWNALDPDYAKLHIRCTRFDPGMKEALLAAGKNTYEKSWCFIDPVSEDDMISSMRGYHFGVIPYLPTIRNHHFCCPNKFGQYLNAGIAVISSNTKNIPEKIHQGKLGMVYDPFDLEATVEALAAFLGDVDRVQACQINSLNFAKDFFEWNRQCYAFIDALDQRCQKLSQD